MKSFFLSLILPLLAVTSAIGTTTTGTGTSSSPLSVVVDLTHGYSFYTGFGTFLHHYMKPGQNGVNNWRSFKNLQLDNANVFILPACDDKVPYTDDDKAIVKKFVENGGGLVIMGSPGSKQQNAIAGVFDVQFGASGKAPLSFTANSGLSGEIESPNGFTLTFSKPEEWQPLVVNADGVPVLAEKKVGHGKVLAASSTLFGQRSQKKEGSINNEWINGLLVRLGSGRQVNLDQKVDGGDLVRTDNSRQVGSLVYHWSDYLAPSAEAMIKMDTRCRPSIEKFMGVPLSPGMSSEVGLLATGGGGYSNGRHIGLAVFWGGFPEREDSMIEFITHENVHSWVHPHAEPYWNEPIATYVGDLVMGDQGYPEEAAKRIANTIKPALAVDPEMKLYDLNGNGPDSVPKLDPGQQRAVNWGKSFWVFEQLRKDNPDFLAKYFQAKRKYVPAKLKHGYSLDDAVAIMSIAAGKDLFPWFCEHGMPVSRDKVQFQTN
ncbi:hypothetical protein QET93_007170 [Akkermansia sp. N21116]|jgi:hypothetical protein|uniref:hypothetical protein n=1 Tax=Akkermansia sp. N21116 TaxID=3040764 RepID=UPI00244EC32C|nr:hypothetical protein [Akkermansia sp. N21116]WPX39322.1 hypothetical protein QET93_007170 [Akkermansia sp. N21116]